MTDSEAPVLPGKLPLVFAVLGTVAMAAGQYLPSAWQPLALIVGGVLAFFGGAGAPQFEFAKGLALVPQLAGPVAAAVASASMQFVETLQGGLVKTLLTAAVAVLCWLGGKAFPILRN